MKRTHKIILASLAVPIAGLAGANIAVYNDKDTSKPERSTVISGPEPDTCWVWDGDEYELLGQRDCPSNKTAYDVGFRLGEQLKNDPGALNAFIEQCEGVRDDPFCDIIRDYQDRRIAK